MDHKGIAEAILSKTEEPEASDEDADINVAGSNVMDAMKNGDSAAFTSALKEFVAMCGGYGEGESE